MNLNSFEVDAFAKSGSERTADESSSLCESIQNLHISTAPEEDYNYPINSTTRRSLDSASLPQASGSDNKSMPDKIEKENKKIRYTKEFLLILRAHDNSNKVPNNLPSKIEGEETYWDPEKYFDSLYPKKSDEQSSSTVTTNTINKPRHQTNKNAERLNGLTSCPSSCEDLNPGDMVQINFCSLNTSNDFFVNLLRAKEDLHKMYTAINEVGKRQSFSRDLIGDFLDEPIILALSENFWYRVKLVNRTSPVKAFCIDNAKEFEPEGYLSCPVEFRTVPGYGLNIALHGVDSFNFDLKALLEFVREAKAFWIKIVYVIKSKHFVELFNEKCVSINGILNPRLPQTIHCH